MNFHPRLSGGPLRILRSRPRHSYGQVVVMMLYEIQGSPDWLEIAIEVFLPGRQPQQSCSLLSAGEKDFPSRHLMLSKASSPQTARGEGAATR